MANSPYVDIRKVIDTTAEQRKPVDFLHTKKIIDTTITFSSAAWVATPGSVDGEYYQDFTIIGLTAKHAAIVILNTSSSAYLDRGNFTTCYTTIDGKLRLHWTAPIVSSSQITIPTIITFETGNTAPIRGLLNGGGGGSGGTGDWVYDPADMGIFLDYLAALGDLSAYYLQLQSVIDGFATYFSSDKIDGKAIIGETIDAGKLTVHGPNKITDFDTFEQFKNQNLAGAGGDPMLPINYGTALNNVIANVVSSEAYHGAYSLKLQNQTINDYIYLNPKTFVVENWLIMDPGAYGFSFYIKNGDAANLGEIGVVSLYDATAAPVLITGTNVSFTGTSGLWKRFFVKFTVATITNATIRVDFSKATTTSYIDGIQLEKLEDIAHDISAFSGGGVTTISGNNITTGVIDASLVNVTNLNADNINTGALNADLITTGTLDANVINVENLDASKITTGLLDALRIATGSLDADKITSKTIEAEQIKSFSITATEISSNAITTEKLFAESVTAAKIAAESIDSTKLNAVFGNFTGTLKVGPVGNDITLSGIEGAAKIYTGLGNHGGTTTGFYLDDTGKFSLTNQLIFTPGLENTLSELEITGKIRGIIESVEPIPSEKLSSAITQIAVNGDGTIGTITTTGHSFMVGERILISGMTETLFNRAYTISSIIDSTIFTVEIIDFIIAAGTYTGTDPVAELQELTMGLHLSEHFGTSYYHNAGSGIRLDKYNWWLTNNQFRVGTASTYFKWNGDSFNIQGSGTKSLVFNVGSSDENNIISITNNNLTPTYNTNTSPFYVDGSGRFSLGNQLYWDGSLLTIAADVVIQPIASLEQTVATMTSTITNVNNTFSFLPTGLEIRNESTSTNYIKIDNDSIDFMTENGVVATMASVGDDTYMEIKDARISNSIELGVHRIRRYDTGGNSYTIFEWKGV